MAESVLKFKYNLLSKIGFDRLMKQWFCRTRHQLNFTSFRHSQTLGTAVVLSKDNRERCVARLKTMTPIRVDGKMPVRKAAVLVPLCIVNHEVCLLYTLRSNDLKNYRGQVSFPGGVQDSTDGSLEETALRETHEELGIIKSDIDIWGHGNFVGTGRQEMVVLPHVGYIGEVDPKKLKLNPVEVESVFTVSLKHLCDPVNHRYTHFRGKYTLPVFVGAEHTIWGMTAIITHIVLAALLPGTYKNKLDFLKLEKAAKIARSKSNHIK